jgi:hypothetical protein
MFQNFISEYYILFSRVMNIYIRLIFVQLN